MIIIFRVLQSYSFDLRMASYVDCDESGNDDEFETASSPNWRRILLMTFRNPERRGRGVVAVQLVGVEDLPVVGVVVSVVSAF